MNPALAGLYGALVGFALLRKIFPAKKLPEISQQLDDLKIKYRKTEIYLCFVILFGGAFSGYLIWMLLKTLSDWRASLWQPAEFVFAEDPAYWMIAAMFLGIISSFPISIYAAKLLLKEKYAEYISYQSIRYKFDQLRAIKIFSVLGITGCTIFIFLGLCDHVILNGNELISTKYPSVKEIHYSLNDIEKIETAPQLINPNGSIVHRQEYIVFFKNSVTWTTNIPILGDISSKEKRNFINVLSNRSGVPIQEVDAFQYSDFE